MCVCVCCRLRVVCLEWARERPMDHSSCGFLTTLFDTSACCVCFYMRGGRGCAGLSVRLRDEEAGCNCVYGAGWFEFQIRDPVRCFCSLSAAFMLLVVFIFECCSQLMLCVVWRFYLSMAAANSLRWC